MLSLGTKKLYRQERTRPVICRDIQKGGNSTGESLRGDDEYDFFITSLKEKTTTNWKKNELMHLTTTESIGRFFKCKFKIQDLKNEDLHMALKPQKSIKREKGNHFNFLT